MAAPRATRAASSPKPRSRTGKPSSRRAAPKAPRLPVCGWSFDGRTRRQRGDHLCKQRADHAQAFAEEICVHTKDRWAWTPFILAGWQRDDIVRPLFGEARWDPEWECSVRRYRSGWIEPARKNGKSELLAFVALYPLVGDGVESAEVYGAARDKDQARLVFNVAARMVALSPVLSKRLRVIEYSARAVTRRPTSCARSSRPTRWATSGPTRHA
jgi:phage terminase large subunit-like protein